MAERLVSRLYRPDPDRCCEGCVFGGEHAPWCGAEPHVVVSDVGTYVFNGESIAADLRACFGATEAEANAIVDLLESGVIAIDGGKPGKCGDFTREQLQEMLTWHRGRRNLNTGMGSGDA